MTYTDEERVWLLKRQIYGAEMKLSGIEHQIAELNKAAHFWREQIDKLQSTIYVINGGKYEVA